MFKDLKNIEQIVLENIKFCKTY